MVIRESRGDRIFNIVNVIVLFLILLITAYPLYFVLIASFSDPDAVSTGKTLLWPTQFTFGGYEQIFAYAQIWIGYRNTLFYTVFGTLIALVITLPSAYALSRKDLKFNSFFSIMFLITMFFSGGMIPSYLLVTQTLHMGNTIWSILIPGATNMFYIIIARTFFSTTIPDEMREAAEIDGCSNFRLFISIVLPLSSAIIAVMALYNMVDIWNGYFNAYLYLTSNDSVRLQPLSIILRQILIIGQAAMEQIQKGQSENSSLVEYARRAQILKYSLIVVSVVPILCVYPFVQKYFVKGVMIGAVKG